MAKIGTGRMSLLQRREIEAQIAAPLVKAFMRCISGSASQTLGFCFHAVGISPS